LWRLKSLSIKLDDSKMKHILSILSYTIIGLFIMLVILPATVRTLVGTYIYQVKETKVVNANDITAYDFSMKDDKLIHILI